MKTRMFIAAAVAAAMLTATPINAAYKLIAANAPVNVAKSALIVTPPADWNKLPASIGKKAEAWTLDGLNLNELVFYGGIAGGEAMVRETNKKDKPLPKFNATMLIPDVANMFETTLRAVTGTANYKTESIEPATFARSPGFRFTYSYTVSDEVPRKGEATGAIIGGKLYMMAYSGPQTHYFDRDLDQVRKIAASAKIGAPPAK